MTNVSGMGSLPKDDRAHLESFLQEAHMKYAQTNPLSRKSHNEACKFMPGGNTRTVLHTTPFPLTIASGEGCMLRSVDQDKYCDFLGEYTAGIYGHNHPVIRKAIEEALDNGWSYGGHNIKEQQLARTVCERFPSIQKVRFVNSGTEANMMALATAIAYTGKKKVLVFNKGYHGSTISGLVETNKPSINLPHDFVVGDYNDAEGAVKMVRSLPDNSLAAVLVEPMLGSGGCYEGSQDFLSKLRDLATEQRALLIFDEVMTSRLSYHGQGHNIGITPDLMTVGKWVGGGMSFGAFGGVDRIMSMYDPRSGQLVHAGTFNNNIFSMSAGVAGCALLTADVLNQLNTVGDKLQTDLQDTFDNFGIKGTVPSAPLSERMHQATHPQRPPKMFVKGVGSLLCIHFAGPDQSLLQGLFYHHMLLQHIYMAPRGFIALNIELKEDHLLAFVSAVRAFCETWNNCLKW